MNEDACYGKGYTICSSGQIEWFKNCVDDRSVQVGGQQWICTIDGCSMPLVCRSGLMYLSLLLGLQTPLRGLLLTLTLMNLGNYTQRAFQTLNILDDSSQNMTPLTTIRANQQVFSTNKHVLSNDTPDYEKLRLYFGWVNVDTVQKTIEQATQWGVSTPNTFPMKRHLKSRNPALNIPRHYEAVAADTIFCEIPVVDSEVKQALVFVGRDTLVADAYPMKSGKQFVNTIEDNIRRQGATDKLLSDSARTEISNKVMGILRADHISNWHSEPYHQNQNPAE